MFHGTKATDPAEIYQSSEGFNINYANPGYWGKGIYFAQKSSYSHDYRSTLPSGSNQMFMASIIVGETIELEP